MYVVTVSPSRSLSYQKHAINFRKKMSGAQMHGIVACNASSRADGPQAPGGEPLTSWWRLVIQTRAPEDGCSALGFWGGVQVAKRARA